MIRLSGVVGSAVAVVAGITLYCAAVTAIAPGSPLPMKLKGRATYCPWGPLLHMERDLKTYGALAEANRSKIRKIGEDPKLGLERFSTSRRSFWIPTHGAKFDGSKLLNILLAEHDWDVALRPHDTVQKGDVVIDVGAHIGTFTSKALELGASRVIGFEPDPFNAECFRRNFATEIADGRVLLIEKGAWSEPSTMTLSLGDLNSGMSSMVLNNGVRKVQVPVVRIDDVVAELKIEKLNFIKMDIEGAERNALRGAMATLKRFRPRLMLDWNHREDDPIALPAVIHEAYADYKASCGPCEISEEHARIEPHVVFFR